MIKDDIKKDLQNARLVKDIELKKFLGVIVGEIQLVESRNRADLTDDQTIVLLKKFKKSAIEMIKYGSATGIYELEVLKSYLPDVMTVEAIKKFMLDGYADEIRGADNVMRLIGKFKKLLDGKAEGGTIKDALVEITAN